MSDELRPIYCPLCGSIMVWESTASSEECGFEVEGLEVQFYSCRKCGTEAEFVLEYGKIERDD